MKFVSILCFLLFSFNTLSAKEIKPAKVMYCSKVFKNSLPDILKAAVLDNLKLVDMYRYLPDRLKLNLYQGIDQAKPEDLDKVVRFYDKYLKRFAAPAAFMAIIGYIAKYKIGVPFITDHYSNMILMPALMNVAYAASAEQYPMDRKRLLVNLVLISVVTNIYWEVGPLEKGWERFPPQSPRLGTDWGDLLTEISSSAMYYPLMRIIDYLKFKPKVSKVEEESFE